MALATFAGVLAAGVLIAYGAYRLRLSICEANHRIAWVPVLRQGPFDRTKTNAKGGWWCAICRGYRFR
jgi:hypothetical protein